LAQGFLSDRKQRLRRLRPPSQAKLAEVFNQTLFLLYRLLFLLHAENRNLLPAGEAGYRAVSLQRIKEEIAREAGPDPRGAAARLRQAYSERSTFLHRRLTRTFQVLAAGDSTLKVSRIGGALFAPAGQNSSLTSGFIENARVPDQYLAAAIDLLARDRHETTLALAFIDYHSLGVRHLGAIYERLLECELKMAQKGEVYLSISKPERKGSGAYYTPDAIVKYIVGHTLGPVLARKLKALRSEFRDSCRTGANNFAERLLDFKVIDPAMGSGHFLVEAANFISDRMLGFLARFSGNPGQLADRASLKRRVVEQCIHGFDVDPMSVELARISLWLDAGDAGLPLQSFDHRLRCCNALTELEAPAFDCVVGNPPYGIRLDPATKRRIRAVLPLTRSNPDTAAAFLELGMNSLGPGGRLGLVVPKPLTYSYRWREARKLLHRRLHLLLDVSRAWPEVLLEQVVVIAGKGSQGPTYDRQTLAAGRFSRPCPISWAWAARHDTLPCALTEREQQLVESLSLHTHTLGHVCKTFRGLGCQRFLRESGGMPIIGGRDLERWRIRSFSGHVTGVDRRILARFQRPKLVFQNIIAHIARPWPHIALIGTNDSANTLTLDTVNNIIPKVSGIDLLAVLALLHSDFVNWFVYAVVYNKAIRTMHFDQYFLDKIPLPASFDKVQKRLSQLAEQCIEAGEIRVARPETSKNVIGDLPEPGTSLEDSGRAAPQDAMETQSAQERINELVAAAYGAGGFSNAIQLNGNP
jgi:type I restriction-modification system DNA methylase subunit